ncbi:Gag-Pol polyprotein-like Protein [Elysia marginata]|uniref:Gag-Pol polyprotein-like Protein n=1 Tax=Elysia marginata TaxID=1093978 RepID=A0AAV4GCG1_9GAST|nr:Gag-Pol polyprotein-like Protein [Elysia marginata]
MVKGTRVELIEKSKLRGQHLTHNHIPRYQRIKVNEEIANLASHSVIKRSILESDDVISGIFTREKKDGSLRVILNLKNLNEYITYQKFKMETLRNALTLVTHKCFMASIDIYHAYFSVPIAAEDQKCLKLEWDNELYHYQFTCYPNGLSQTPRNFTKLTKPIYGTLHSKGHISTGYLDDSLLIGKSFDSCQQNIESIPSPCSITLA